MTRRWIFTWMNAALLLLVGGYAQSAPVVSTGTISTNLKLSAQARPAGSQDGDPNGEWTDLGTTPGSFEVAAGQELGLNPTDRDNFGDAELAQLALDLAKLTNLTKLDLANTRVTDAGLAHLAGFLRLRELVFEDTRVTAAGVAALKAKLMPGCYIIG